jgi:hypothetical protein
MLGEIYGLLDTVIFHRQPPVVCLKCLQRCKHIPLLIVVAIFFLAFSYFILPGYCLAKFNIEMSSSPRKFPLQFSPIAKPRKPFVFFRRLSNGSRMSVDRSIFT